MGKARDLGAALSLGLAATTKQKEAEAKYETRQGLHRGKIDSFNQLHERTIHKMVELATSWNEGKEVILKSGALTVDPEGNLAPGWFSITGAGDVQIPEGGNRKSAAIAIGSLPSVAALLGAPAAAWTAVGAFGTAVTGTSIGALSGAAAVTATASWFGRAGIAGAAGLGMRAAPAALGGIGLLATLPVQGVVGAIIAGKNERRKIRQVDAATAAMNRYDSRIDHYSSEMNHLLQDAQKGSADLIRASSRLDAMMESHGANSQSSKEAAETLLQQMALAQDTCNLFQELQADMHRELVSDEQKE